MKNNLSENIFKLVSQESIDSLIKLDVIDEKIKSQFLFNDLLLNSCNHSTFITDRTGKILWVNDNFCSNTGYSRKEILNKNPRILKSGKHTEKFYTELWNTILQGEIWQGVITNKTKNGTLIDEVLKIVPVHDEKNNISYFLVHKENITDKLKIDEALTESYIKYEELSYLINQSPAIGFLFQANEKRYVEFVTDNIKKFGYTLEDFYSQELTFDDIIFEEDRENVIKDMLSKIESGYERFEQQFRVITKSGEVRWVDSHLYVRLGEEDKVTHVQSVILDSTARKIAEEEAKTQFEQLMQADKMIALGTLVSGVAHEINNPNNFVILNIPIIEKVWFKVLPILEQHYEENGDFYVGDKLKFSKIKESMPLLLGGINDGALRIKNIVEDLKSFARKETPNFEQDVNLNKVIQTSVNLTANLVSKSTDNFKVKYSQVPIIIKGNKQRLEQVIINLIENSCQALTERNQLIRITISKDNKFGYVSVEDEGSGMKKEELKKITDPFFTTKRNKGGTGLGLSIASKIIMQHKGSLSFSSEHGVGTKATIKIPR
ncbi:MAG: hypothetical protein CR986_07030 [Ignavibacteriae bacterium]|nr:MAG: hypothetical protein CR986_07030 [Ignavibacteriota bacterium]